ncbi:HAMP domain-containing sensor histidine kinase [Streptomyces bohaiensis]|uniref:HAMP domain-containing sensor histidine kinase n=1 Tax=Streptomyces bohaiensis TaxID=1431344 RepID=UPI003B80EE3C
MKTRTALGATAVVAVALLAAALLMLQALRQNLTDQVDLQAENTARGVAVQLATGSDFDELELDSDRPVQVVDEDGIVRAVGPGLEAVRGTGTESVDPVPWPEFDDDDDDGSGAVGDEVRLFDGVALVNGEAGDYRFAAIDAETPDDLEVTVYAGSSVQVGQTALASVRSSLLTGFPPLLLVVAGVTWLVTWWALRPVEGIRRELATITHSEDLSRRVPEPTSRDEIGRLADTTNETLAVLEASVDRQRRFVADASHELRSPIASLRTQLEVGAAHPELLDLPGAVKDTVRLQTLAADLLLLARLDAGERPVGSGRVELAELVAEQVDARGAARNTADVPVTVTADRLEPAAVPGSAGMVERVLVNLLDNAERHAASRVRVSVTAEGGHGVVEVADDGAGVPVGERERIFQRFVRLDEARSRDAGGAGLGLAIARDVAERHGGTLTVGAAREGGALFVLRIPGLLPPEDADGPDVAS